jgi:PhzF family phenazine biosynthesis protein
LLEALGTSATYFGRTRFDVLVQLDSAAALRALRPDFRKLAAVPARGVIVTAASDDPRYHFLSRFFAPVVGIDEDPATGSAHCALTPYWAERFGQTTMTAYQASERGGVVQVQLKGERVILGGHAVTIWDGHLVV